MAAWPVAEDLKEWLRYEAIASESGDAVQQSFAAASAKIRRGLDATALSTDAAANGIDVDVPADLAAWCPDDVRLAILIRAAFLFCRKDSANGSISFGEFATRVAKMDPDVKDLTADFQCVDIP